MKLLSVTGAGVPPALGHYSHLALLSNGIVYMSGQKAWDPDTGLLIEGDITAQTRRIFRNVQAILNAAGLSLKSVARVSCHLRDIQTYPEFNAVYAEAFGDIKPTRTVLGGYELRDGALVELVFECAAEP